MSYGCVYTLLCNKVLFQLVTHHLSCRFRNLNTFAVINKHSGLSPTDPEYSVSHCLISCMQCSINGINHAIPPPLKWYMVMNNKKSPAAAAADAIVQISGSISSMTSQTKLTSQEITNTRHDTADGVTLPEHP